MEPSGFSACIILDASEQPRRDPARKQPPDDDDDAISTVLKKAMTMLQEEFLNERVAMNSIMEAHHREVSKNLMASLRPHLDELVRTGGATSDATTKRSPRDTSKTAPPPSTVKVQDEVLDKVKETSATSLTSATSETPSSSRNDGERPPTPGLSSVRQKVERIVDSKQFEILFGLLIFANAAVMAVQRQYEGERTAHMIGWVSAGQLARPVQEAWPQAEDAFNYLEWGFGMVFTLEVVLKLACLPNGRFFREPGAWPWNIFDLVIVLVWLFDRTTKGLPLDPTLLRMARIMRLLRLLRVLRWLQMIDPLILMVKAIKSSVSVLIWSLLIMVLLIAVVAMVMGAFLEPTMRNVASPDDVARATLVFKQWGTFTRAMETMFEITLANWGPPTSLLMNEVSEMWAFWVLLYKLTLGFAVVQVIMAVFIQQTFKVASRDEEVMIKEKQGAAKAYQKTLKHLFQEIDVSGDGMLKYEEFHTALRDARVKTWFAALEVDATEAEQLFDLLDDGDGLISQDEFLTGVKALKGAAKGTDMLALKKEMKMNHKDLKTLATKVDMILMKFATSDRDVAVCVSAVRGGEVSNL